MTENFLHVSVLKNETINCLFPNKQNLDELIQKGEKTFIFSDFTMGGAGHSLAFIEKFSQHNYFSSINLHLIGFDRDQSAINFCSEILKSIKEKHQGFSYQLVNDNFSNVEHHFKNTFSNIKVHAMIADLGVSSPHLDNPHRGFSIKNEGPIDMRMDQQQELNAEFVLQNYSESALTKLFFEYGEEPKARKLAKAIVEDRKTGKLPLQSTVAFAEYIRKILSYHSSRTHPATRTFQALRIEVNQELASLKQLLRGVPKFISPGGKIGLISFHSLEDRIIKHMMRSWQKGKLNEEDNFETIKQRKNFPFPFNLEIGHPDCFGKEIPRGGIVPSEEECKENPRARSSRLRCFVFDDEFTYPWGKNEKS
ncbi:MAG: 16S rRNA (cytosine(1402)-N(4))-methyltransferase RsmH [Silvanigrellaceae bacterium]|nr:16S rRNA (cytosine(1402)-N(4))-methyltransferase RsmH [Silvanigrellaceae bacterium]